MSFGQEASFGFPDEYMELETVEQENDFNANKLKSSTKKNLNEQELLEREQNLDFDYEDPAKWPKYAKNSRRKRVQAKEEF